MSDNPETKESEEQLIEIARLAYELDSESGPCDHQQAKDCEYCPCTVKAFAAAMETVLTDD